MYELIYKQLCDSFYAVENNERYTAIMLFNGIRSATRRHTRGLPLVIDNFCILSIRTLKHNWRPYNKAVLLENLHDLIELLETIIEKKIA